LQNNYVNDVKLTNHGLRDWYKETFNGISETTKYNYDALKRLTSVENPKGNGNQFYYDESNQPIRIKSGATNVTIQP
jgi:YD repeat-containing protein